MTIKEIIELADEAKPNDLPMALKVRWIAELDGKIAADVFQMGKAELEQFSYTEDTAAETTPLVEFPHDDVYRLWLVSMIDMANGEYGKYQNSATLYNEAYGNFVRWFARTYKMSHVTGKLEEEAGFYITAYGLAVRHGYSGTLEQWLESKGVPVPRADWEQKDAGKADYIRNKPSIPKIDGTLTKAGAGADAKVAGEKIAGLLDRIAATNEKIAVEKARIDNLAKLEEGSTTGDAELADMRVDYNGEIHDSAGDAVRAQAKNAQEGATLGFYSRTPDANLINMLTEQGTIDKATGADVNGDKTNITFVRSNYIPLGAGEIIKYTNMRLSTTYAAIAVYDKNKGFLSAIAGNGTDSARTGVFTMPQDGYIRLSNSTVQTYKAKVGLITQKKELNILVLGNSFSQDAFAYLPPVLNEILPEYKIAYGVCYRSGAEVNDHIKLYNGELGTPNTDPEDGKYDGKYTWFNYWDYAATKWGRYSNATSAKNGKSLRDIMSMKKWDIIYVQPNCAVSSNTDNQNESVNNSIVNPARELLRILQQESDGQFAFMMGQWLATADGDNGEKIFALISDAMQRVKQRVGIYDYIPIGTAIQNARTNESLQSLDWEKGNFIYDDNGHMQSGIPALIATYAIALKVLDFVGEAKRGIYGSTFEPTTDNCIAIGAYKDKGMEKPLPMTHGESVGVTAENIKAAQEYAVLAVSNPTRISDGIHSSNAESSGGTGEGGADGFSPIAKVEQTDDGAVITITDKKGTTTATVKNGANGYTPVKGTDYYTEEDKQEIIEEVLAEIPSGGGGDSVWTESTEHPGCFYRMVGGETEWQNPPMVIGEEYRTAERSKGDIVYTKLVDCGVLADGENTIEYHNGVVYPTRFSGTIGTNYTLPIIAPNDANRSCTLYVVKNKIKITKGNNVTNSGKAFVQVWYTKAADGEKYLAVITHPTDVTASDGDTVYFSVVAEGEGLTYQWQFYKTSWLVTGSDGNTTDTITVAVNTGRNGYKYRCIITDKYGNSIISDPATLTVS